MERLFQDLRYAFRRMAKSPGFTSIAVLSLALGIGANTAIFSLVNAVLLSGIPMRAPQEMVEVYKSEEDDGYAYSISSVPDLFDLRERTDVFSGVAGYEAFFSRLETDDGVEPVWGEVVSWDIFSILGIAPHLGRFFVAEEGQTQGTHPVAVLGFNYWQRMFGGDPGIVGRTIRLSGREWTVVGVAPEAVDGFTSPGLAMDMFITYQMGGTVNFEGVREDYLDDRGSHGTFIKARLAPGVSVEQAQAALDAMSAQNREAYPESWRGRSFNVLPSAKVSIHPIVDGPLLGVAALLLTVVGLVLLIACTNLAGFLLARASQRRKEIAVRLALGAKRWTLIRQLLTETVVLAILGGGAGLLVANWALQALVAFKPPIPIPINLDVGLDRTVLLFTLGISVAAGVFFGLVPALQSTNPDVAPTLKDETGSGAGRPRRFSLRNTLIVSQVAISMVLLLGAGLFLRSLQAARDIDIGFSIREGGIAWVMAMGAEIDREEFSGLVSQLRERVTAQPGIDAVASAAVLPLGIAFQTRSFDIPGVEPPAEQDHHEIAYNAVSASFFDVWGIPIVAGRALSSDDRAGTEPVVVISETAGRRFWPGEDPIGKTLISLRDEVAYRIVGVAKDTKAWTLGEEYRPYVYMAQGQRSDNMAMFVATGTLPEAQIAGQLRTVVQEVDPRLVLMESKTVSEHLSIALFPPRMAALLLAVFGGLALILASTGLYGAVTFNVSRRSREMGIRMSLGADARRVIGMVLRTALTLVAVGAGIGVILSVGLAQLVRGFLYGIGALDPVTFVGVPLFLAFVALVAALLPARRASRINPVEALRSE